jgi:hypothetical protein
MGEVPASQTRLKLGKERLFTGPVDIPLSFFTSHPYVIEFQDGTLLRFGSLRCAAQSAVNYGLPMIDQWTDLHYSLDQCKVLARAPHLHQFSD